MTEKKRRKGQFKPGQSGNPNGRPKKKREDRYLEIALSACTFKDWQAIMEKAVRQAKSGNPVARKWLSDTLIGVPVRRLEVDAQINQVKGYVDVNPEDWDDENTDIT